MQIPVLIEPRAEGGFVATGTSLGLTATGASAADALAALESLMRERERAGEEVDAPDVSAENPWAVAAGIFKDDPLYDEWQEEVAKYRREREADPNTL